MSFRSTVPVLCSFLVLLPLGISLGHCSDISFSLCWFNKNHGLESQNYNIWINGTAVGSIRKADKLISLTVYPGVENKLALQYKHSTVAWVFTLNQRTRHTKVKGTVKPTDQPTNATLSFLQRLGPSEVFACENSTLFFHQRDDFFLAIGHTTRLPVKLESRSSSMLLLSWRAPQPSSAPVKAHSVELYRSELGSFSLQRLETTTDPHHRFTALNSCSVYVPCVQISGTHSLTCLSTITDPDEPRDLQVSSVNSSSLSVSWDCPLNRRYSAFLLTVYHHQHALLSPLTPPLSPLSPPLSPLSPPLSPLLPVEQQRLLVQDPLEWTVSDLAPCSRLSFGVQTVCVSGAEARYSPEIRHKGNSDQSDILNMAQSSSGPDWVSVHWEVGQLSSVSRFRVSLDGIKQGSTLNTSFTVRGLQPCHIYSLTVEALCGEGTVMDAQTMQVHTVPRGVSGLQFLPDESVAVWTPGSEGPFQGVSFMFELSEVNGGQVLWSDRVWEPHLPLTALQGGVSYRLTVWEECEGLGSSHRTTLEFKAENSTELQPRARAGRPIIRKPQEPKSIIALVVPWTLPEHLLDETSELWAQMTSILQHRMEDLLRKVIVGPIFRVELLSAEPAKAPESTEFLFRMLRQTKGDKGPLEPLWVEASRPFFLSLWHSVKNITIQDGALHWTGPDECVSSPCPQSSVCLNTLGSFRCLCRDGHYDVSAFLRKPSPVCNDKGMFSRCLDKQLMGGISKLYLRSQLQGALKVSLNQGQCEVNETQDFYYFKTPPDQSQCGTRRRVNESHIELQNLLTVSGGGRGGGRGRGGGKEGKEGSGGGAKVRLMWKCVYPRHYLRTAQVGVELDSPSSFSVVAYNSSVELPLLMTLHRDQSYASVYSDAVTLTPDDALHFQVSLQTSHTFIRDLRLQVDSCWATESPDPQDQVQGVFLQDGCPVDETFSWLSKNGADLRCRFSIQMFQLPLGRPLYFHCRAVVCGPLEDCHKSCPDQRRRRSVSQSPAHASRAAVVSVGPLVVTKRRASLDKTSERSEPNTVLYVVAGTIGLLAVILLFVSAVKAVMNYYEQLRHK